MKKSARVLAGVAGAALFLLVGGIAIVAGADPTPAATVEPGIGRSGAVSRVRLMLPNAANLTASDVQGIGIDKFYSVDGQGIHANVDAQTGRVRTLFIANRVPTLATVSISPGQALAIAKAYLKSNGISEVGQAAQVTLVDRGDTKEYVVEWRMRVNGAWIPDTRSVSMGLPRFAGQIR